MQYLLTEEEFNALNQAIKDAWKEGRDTLQKVCTMAADGIPIDVPWDKGKKSPWGCILTKKSWYCDLCPVRKMCPHPNKNFSK